MGPAITFLFVGPAINILALAYTGVAIGMGIALARIALSIAFGIGIGLIMALLFRRDDAARDAAGPDAFAASASVPRAELRGRGFSRWTAVALALVAATLVVAVVALRLTPAAGGPTVAFPGKFFAVGAIRLLIRRFVAPTTLRRINHVFNCGGSCAEARRSQKTLYP